MPKPDDVGRAIHYMDNGGLIAASVMVQMWIKGPKGECYIYDSIWKYDHPNDNIENKCLAIQAFMEFNNYG